MGTRQRKVKGRRSKRQEKQRARRILTLRNEKRLRSDANPLHACFANRDWYEDGMASIMVARRTAPERVTMAAFLVDRLAMGLKDAWGRTDMGLSEFNEHVNRAGSGIDLAPMNLGTAMNLVYGGIQLACELGFRLPRRYERWTAILGALPDGESPDMSMFLDNGKIMLVCSERDLEARLVGTTAKKFLARPDVHYLMGTDDFTVVDEEEDESRAFLDQMEEAMLSAAKRWCFANGQVPDPLLPEVIGASLEAIVQAFPEGSEAEDAIVSIPPWARDRMAEEVTEFVAASLGHDRDRAEAAVAQLHGFMNSLDSSEKLFTALGLSDR